MNHLISSGFTIQTGSASIICIVVFAAVMSFSEFYFESIIALFSIGINVSF